MLRGLTYVIFKLMFILVNLSKKYLAKNNLKCHWHKEHRLKQIIRKFIFPSEVLTIKLLFRFRVKV